MDTLTASQLSEWEVYDSIDPIGDFRIEMLLAQGFSILANLLIKAHFKSGSKLTEPKDFLIDWTGELAEEEQKKQSAEEMKRFMMQFAKEHNKKVEKMEKMKRKK